MSKPVRPETSQDLAPKGGYPSIRFRRDLPHKTISAGLVGVGLTLLSGFGMYQLSHVWRERRYFRELRSAPYCVVLTEPILAP